MEFAALLALLVTAYEAYQAKKATTGDDNPDAVIETIMPELVKYFASLFKSDTDGFFAALNGMVLGLYHISGDALQFIIRLMVNMRVEKLQGRYPWMSLPFLIFIKGYFGALEEATKGKDKPTADDIKAAADKVAAEAKKAASDLKSKFDAAKEAVKGMHIPPNSSPPPPGGPVPPHAPHVAPSGSAPAAGGTGKTMGERFSALVAMLPALKEGLANAKEHLGNAIDGAENVAKHIAYGLLAIAIAMVTTGLAQVLIVVKAPEWAWATTVVLTLAWGLVPLCMGLYAAKTVKNGFGKLGVTALAIVVTGSVSSLVIAVIHGVAAFGHYFSWVYIAINLGAVVLADFLWRFGDMTGDALKAIIRIIPDKLEAPWMSRATIGFRKALFTLAVADTAVMFLVGLFAQWEHTLYGVGTVGIAVLSLLMAAYGYSRVSLTENEVAADLSATTAEHRQLNLKRFYWAATGLTLALLVSMFAFNAIVPPTPDANGELPSYAERWAGSGLKKVGDDLGSEVVGGETSVAANTCSPQVEKFVGGIQKGDCQVILKESSDTTLLSLCNQAVKCGAMNDAGSKKPTTVRKVGPRDAGFNWWYVGVPTAIALFLGLAWIGRKDPSAEKKEEKKPAAH